MPGEKTIYRKIQIVLDYVKSGKHHDYDSLLNYIYHRSPTNFLYYWRDLETDEIKFDYSKKSINRILNLTIELKLLSRNTMSLTKNGVSATDPRRFPTVIGKRVTDYLNSKQIPLKLIEKAIRDAIQENNPMPPTSLEIWDQLDLDEDVIKLIKFKQMINLLGQCNILYMTQKRIFLPLT